MSIREGIYLDENEQPLPEFMQLVDEYERKLQRLAETTMLPDVPDYDKINKMMADVHEAVVYGNY